MPLCPRTQGRTSVNWFGSLMPLCPADTGTDLSELIRFINAPVSRGHRDGPQWTDSVGYCPCVRGTQGPTPVNWFGWSVPLCPRDTGGKINVSRHFTVLEESTWLPVERISICFHVLWGSPTNFGLFCVTSLFQTGRYLIDWQAIDSAKPSECLNILSPASWRASNVPPHGR